MMKLLHISDLHITENGCSIWGVDTLYHFNLLIEKISALHNIDAILLTGDLSNDGSLWSYQYIDKSFASIGIPTFCCPGNHDNLNVMYNFCPNFIRLDKSVQINGWNIIMLNSVVADDEDQSKNKSRGWLADSEFNMLEKEVQKGMPTIISLHHPPIEQEGWLNRKLLENRDRFIDVIQGYSNVKMVLYGHTHYHMNKVINDIAYISAPSVGFGFDKDLPKFQIAQNSEGYGVLEIDSLLNIKYHKETLY